MPSKKRKQIQNLPSGFERVRTFQGVEEYVLKKNGLRVLYKQDSTSPVVGLMVTYLVGSRHEVTGTTGATHILEHLLFKGSKKFPTKKGVSALDVLSGKGALVNASTYFDRTNYFEVLPREHFDFAMQLEADRMRNAIITEKDLEEELPAVLSEIAWNMNNPERFLENEVWGSAFLAHPYQHLTLGWSSDVRNVTAQTLREFYDTHYHPNNAVVSIVGDVERNEALTKVKKYFGVHAPSPHSIPQPTTEEPEQTGRRSAEVKRIGTKNLVIMAFKAPEALHEDTPSLLALDALIGGGDTSRLHRGLVEKQLATEAWSEFIPFHDPSLIELFIVPVEGVSHEQIEEEVLKICGDIVKKGVTKKELTQVKEQTLTSMAFARDGHYATLSVLNEAIAVGDWRFFYTLPKLFEKVTTQDLKAVAKKYIDRDKMTVGYYRAQKK